MAARALLMGVRLYDPISGRFDSLDPVPGGGDNAYGYPGDPVNQFDLNGKWWGSMFRHIWRTRQVQSAANAVVAVGAIFPYAIYAGTYHLRHRLSRRHRRGLYGRAMRKFEYYNLRIDEGLDSFKRHHLGRNESNYDEHIRGSYCPRFMYSWSSQCRRGGHLYGWLPGSYRRHGRVYRDL